MERVYPIKANIIGAGSAKSFKALNRRIRWGEAGTVSTRYPTCGRSRSAFGARERDTVQTPIVDDVKDENPVWLVQISCGQMFVVQSRQSGHNMCHERVAPEKVGSFATQDSPN